MADFILSLQGKIINLQHFGQAIAYLSIFHTYLTGVKCILTMSHLSDR